MAVSFMTSQPYSPELANAMSQAVLHGYTIGAQNTQSELERQFQADQAASKEENDNLRSALKIQSDQRNKLIEEKGKSVAALGKIYEDRIKDNRALLSNAYDHDPAAVERIAGQVKSDQGALSDLWQKFNKDPINFQIPSTADNMTMQPDDAAKMSPQYIQGQQAIAAGNLAKSNTEQNDAAVSNYWMGISGGTISKPSEANTMDLIKARDYRISNPRGGRGAVKKAVDTMGNPLGSDQIKRIGQAMQAQPDLLSQYRTDYAKYHSMPEGDDKGELGSSLKDSADKLRANYGTIARYAQDNATDAERQFMSRIGLGLSPQSVTDDSQKLMSVYNSSTDPNVKAVSAHLYRGLGFGNIPGAPSYNGSTLFQLPSDDDYNTQLGGSGTGGDDLFSKYH